jgi:hypothetical protein
MAGPASGAAAVRPSAAELGERLGETPESAQRLAFSEWM